MAGLMMNPEQASCAFLKCIKLAPFVGAIIPVICDYLPVQAKSAMLFRELTAASKVLIIPATRFRTLSRLLR